jgi:hypothetical protein|tara:strand:- start:404 stop:568 length:165 start_codon:yes stop_codon:yes gene_type:complete
MATTIIKAEGYANMSAAADALKAATNALTLGADTYVGIEKIGSGNWGYWCLHDN